MVQHAGGLGGSAVSLGQLAADLQIRGHRPIIALARPSAILKQFYERQGIETIPAANIACCDHSTVAPRPWYLPTTYRQLLNTAMSWQSTGRAVNRLADTTGADVVHLNSMPLMAAADGLQKGGRPFVWHIREPAPDQGIRTRLIRQIMSRTTAGALVFLSNYDAGSWLGPSGRSTVPYYVLPNAVPDAWLDGSHSMNPPSDSDRVVSFGYFGGFSAIKGDVILLQALKTLQKRNAHWRCILWNTVFSREERDRLSGAARIAGLAGFATRFDRMQSAFSKLGSFVDLRRFSADIPSAIREITFVVFPATVPHFPRPVIEAAAFGRPAVATLLGGIAESVERGASGLLTEAGNSQALADAIECLIKDSALREELGETARQRADTLHRQSNLTLRMLRLYKTVSVGKGL